MKIVCENEHERLTIELLNIDPNREQMLRVFRTILVWQTWFLDTVKDMLPEE